MNKMILKKEVQFGFLYGVLLSLLGFLAAGMGHGTYVLAGIGSAPIGMIGIVPALVGAPGLWACAASLLRNSEAKAARLLFLSLMMIHYLSALLLLTTERFGDWRQFFKSFSSASSALVVLGGLFLYFFGQVTLWVLFLNPALKNKGSERGVAD